MNSRLTLIVFVITVFFHSATGQKIKYKDLFPILDAKNWEEGVPKLRIFLSDPKNAESANANLQMALFLEDRFYQADVVSDTLRVAQLGDSARSFFGIAKSFITEKELKKNDEYYQAFFRRDLRTGEFGIKVSDVHLDIEKKIEKLDKRISDMRAFHSKIGSIETNYRKAEGSYKELVSLYPKETNLMLGAGQDEMTKIQQIKSDASIALSAARDIKDLASKLGSDKYQGDVIIKEIETYGQDGVEATSLRDGQLTLWNYEDWAIDMTSEINGSVGLLKSMVLSKSKEIREKRAAVKKSQNVVVDSLSAELADLFDKYDPGSVVQKLLKTEIYEAKIMKQVDMSINPALQDSSLVGAQLEIFSNALRDARSMSLNLESINMDDLEKAKNYYPDYIKSFFQTYTTASNFVTEMKVWANRQVGWLADAEDFWKEKDNWGVIEIEGEPEKQVALFKQDAPESEFFTLGIPVKNKDEVLAFGVNVTNQKGFVIGFGQDRKMKWQQEFDLPGTESLRYESDTIPAASNSFSFYYYNGTAPENNLAVVSMSKAGQPNWSTVVTVSKDPVDYKFDALTQELTILLYPEEQLPLDTDELGYLVIDRTGTAR